MYCGSCLHDNTLAAALLAEGHDVILQPLYTPTRTDEANVSRKEVFFGGISVYLEQKSALFRYTPRALDRLWDNAAVIRAFSGRGIQTDPRMLAEITVSILRGADGYQRKEISKLVDWLARLPKPDIATLPFSLLIALAKPVRDTLGCPVVCFIQGDELFLENMQEPYRTECLDLIRAQAPTVDGFLAPSEANARFLCEYLRIPESRMHVAPLGIQLEGHGMVERPQGGAFRIGFFSRIAPEKGFHVLCDAYRRLRQREGLPASVFEAAGYLGPDYRGYYEENRRKLAEWGLAGEFRYHGELTREGKIRFLQSLDVASVPATYDEPKGISVIEAMANGVPVVLPRRGSFPELIEKTGGGILVAPDDPEALADGIYQIWSDAALAARLSRRAHEGVRRHYGSAAMAARAIEVFEKVRAGSLTRVTV